MNRIRARFVAAAAAWVAIATFAFPALAESQVVNLYTTREPGLIQPLVDAFAQSTGIRVNSIFVPDGLAERVQAEGARSPADVLMTVDIGQLLDLTERGLTQPVRSATLESAIPANLRATDGSWFALSLRARVVYAAKELGLTSITYEELADPRWEGRLCTRSGQHPYNTALFAAHMAHHGEAATERWLQGLKRGLARAATGGDRDGARDIAGGICDVAVANSYYVGLMRSGDGRDPADVRRWGDARERLRGLRGTQRAEPRRRNSLPRVPRVRRGAEDLRGGELRVSGEARRGGTPDHRRLRQAERRPAPTQRGGAPSRRGQPSRRQGRLRSMNRAR
jgi:iron(III) transport system substrate-binding protein